MTWPFAPLVPLKYGLILADPPWSYEMRSAKGHEKSPEAHYDTMSEDEISALPVGHLAGGDCVLVLWSTWPHLPQAMRVMTAWGFIFKTGGSWTKLTATGKRAFGTGYILRSTTEPFLIGTIGEPRIGSRSIRNLIESERRPIHVTDHAIIRWLERVEGVDIETLRLRIARAGAVGARHGARTVVVPGGKLVLDAEGERIVTVLHRQAGESLADVVVIAEPIVSMQSILPMRRHKRRRRS